MSIDPSTRRFAPLTLVLSLAVLVAALLGPSRTLALTHGPTCPSAHSKPRCSARACAQSSHKGKAHRTAKCHAKHALAKTKSTSSAAPPAAYCEDASAPVRARNGSFSCDDGSEPECEDGATPTRSGKSLLCPITFEEQPASSEAECEESPGACGAGTSSDASEQACEGPASEGSSSLCEAEGS